MMLLVSTLFWACVAAQEHYLYGPTWGYRNYRSKGSIVSLETTLYAGAPPKPAQARLAIWPGMDVTKGLIQPIIVSSDERLYQGGQCGGATPDQWCIFASMVVGNVKQEMGKRVPLGANDALNMKFKWNDALGGYDQWLYIKDKMVSELHIATGKSNSFYIDTECQGKHKGTVNAHKYSNTTIVLSEPNPTWGKQPTNHYKSCADSASSPDGGKTWIIPNIYVEKSEATKDYSRGGQTPGPAFCPGGPKGAYIYVP